MSKNMKHFLLFFFSSKYLISPKDCLILFFLSSICTCACLYQVIALKDLPVRSKIVEAKKNIYD